MEELKQKIIKAIESGLDERANYIFGNSVQIQFYNNWIFLSLFDSRLDAGENTRKVYFAEAITNSEFVGKVEKILTVNNNPIRRQYQYRSEGYPLELPMPEIDAVIHNIKLELPLIVDMFIEQIIRNNEYLNPNLKL
jgi:hypothetical protein